MSASHKESAKLMRTFLKKNNIRALCSMSASCGSNIIRVCTPSYDSLFSANEIEAFCTFAKSIGLSFVRGSEIDPRHESLLVGKNQWNFYL